jgi:hypothetical protein
MGEDEDFPIAITGAVDPWRSREAGLLGLRRISRSTAGDGYLLRHQLIAHMFGKDGGSSDVHDDFAARGMENPRCLDHGRNDAF